MTSPTTAADAFLGQDPVPFYVDGQWTTGKHGNTIEVLRPSTGKLLATISSGDADDIDNAVRAARQAFPSWAARSTRDRVVLLHRWADAIEKHQDTLATIESRDIGKPLAEALEFDVLFSAEGIRYFADVADHVDPRELVAVRGIEAEQRFLPRGVCGFIIPWNAPGSLMVWGTAPALAGGNTVVVKAPELAPMSCLFLCKLAEEVGIPAGVINVVPGFGETAGAALAGHPDIDYISFTGSPRTGMQVAIAAAGNFVPSKMELGGKGAAIVMPDVDVAATAEKLSLAVVRNAGQTCCTATRWLVQESIYDEFVDAAINKLTSVHMGADDDPNTVLGALISNGQRKRVEHYLQRGQDTGATALLDGGPTAVQGLEGGFFVSPVLLTGDTTNVCAQEEIFGPVAYVMPFKNDDDAIAIANDSRYGLANSVWSQDLPHARAVAAQLHAGNSWINAHNVFAYGLPYGGIGMSGWGGGVNSVKTYLDYLRPLTIARPL